MWAQEEDRVSVFLQASTICFHAAWFTWSRTNIAGSKKEAYSEREEKRYLYRHIYTFTFSLLRAQSGGSPPQQCMFEFAPALLY